MDIVHRFSLPLHLEIDFIPEFPHYDDQEVEVSLAGVVLWRTTFEKEMSHLDIRDEVARDFAEKISKLLSLHA